MAKLIIKGRREPIIIENARALKIKERMFGLNGVEKADPTNLIDLGTWSGSYDRIVEIEITEESTEKIKVLSDNEVDEAVKRESWLLLTPEQKAERLSKFILAYNSIRRDFVSPIPEAILKSAYDIQLRYYQRNPRALSVPADQFEGILPNMKATAHVLSEQFSLPN